MSARTRGACLVIFSAVIFGFTPLLAKTIYLNGSNAFTLAFHRFFFGSLIMLGMHLAWDRQSLKISWRELKQLLLCAVGYGGTPIFLMLSYNYLSSGMATTIHFVYPVLVLVGCIAFCHEKLTVTKVLCCVLCMIGILCFYTPGGGVSLQGVLLAFVSGIFYAFYVIYVSQSGLLNLSPCKMGFYLSLISAGGMLVVCLASGNLVFHLTPRGWGLSILLALLLCGIATLAFQVGTKYVGAQNASLLSTFEPLTSVLVGVIVYREALTMRSVLGILCILLAVVLLTMGKKGIDG